MTTALVTGITGQDGGYLAEQLVSEGTLVHGTIRGAEEIPRHLEELGNRVRYHEVDMREPGRLRAVVNAVQPDEVYNLGGMSSVVESWQSPSETAQVNALAVAELLDAIREQQGPTGSRIRLLQASSAEIFAGSSISPQTEEAQIRPTSPYGAAKAYAHQLVQLYRRVGIHGVNVVLYNHESPRRPVSFVTRKITSAVAAIAHGQANELRLGNLDSRRDWGWAPEYVVAMVRALRHPDPSDYVLATGTAHSVSDFVRTAFAVAGIEDWQRYVRVDSGQSRRIDSAELVGDPTKARDVLGWEPQVSFEEVVERMVISDLEQLSTKTT